MIVRIWHGWTPPDRADAYERLLREEVFPEIASRGIPEYHGIDLLRRSGDGEVEFVTMMWFGSWDAVRQFAGDEFEGSYVPDAARRLLSRFDDRSAHYEVVQSERMPS